MVDGPIRTDVREDGSRGKIYQDDSQSDNQTEGTYFTGPRGELYIVRVGIGKNFEATSK